MNHLNRQRTGNGGDAETVEVVVPMIGALAAFGQELHDHAQVSQDFSPVSLASSRRNDARRCEGPTRDGSLSPASRHLVGKCAGCCGPCKGRVGTT